MMEYRVLSLALFSLSLSGCASVMNDSTHAMTVETSTASGQMVPGANCSMTNDYGTVMIKSGATALVRRSGSDLQIACEYPKQLTASGRAISRANSGMFGNIILGGGIGAIVDHNKGTAYTYPTWAVLVFGKSLIFDRSAQKEGQPTFATEVGTPQLVRPNAVMPAEAIAEVGKTVTAPEPAPNTVTVAPKIGQDSKQAERLPEVKACTAEPLAVLTGKGPGQESYSVQCSNGDLLSIRCEFGQCRVLK